LILRELLERGRPKTATEKVADMTLAEKERQEAHRQKQEQLATGGTAERSVPSISRGNFESDLQQMFPGDTTLKDIPPTPTTRPSAPGGDFGPEYEWLQDEKGDWKKEETETSKATRKVQTKEQEALATKKGADLAEKFGEAGRLVGMYKNLEGQFKRVDEDFPGGTGAAAYWTHKAAATPIAPAWLQKISVPLEGASAQRQETKIAAMPIISGQARFVVVWLN